MKKLTKVEIGVPNERGTIDFLFQYDFFAKSRLNYLVYWVNHYSDYAWNESKGYFVNTKETATAQAKESGLFKLLSSENDSIARNAFARLSEMNIAVVTTLAEEYDQNRIDVSYEFPSFPFEFLKVLVVFTDYCRRNSINYHPTSWLKDSLAVLQENIPFPRRSMSF